MENIQNKALKTDHSVYKIQREIRWCTT